MLYNAGDCHGVLSLLNEDHLSNVNKTRIKVLSCYLSGHVDVFYLFIYLLFSHNKDYTSITLYKDVARGPQKTTRLVRGGPLVTIILSNRTITTHNNGQYVRHHVRRGCFMSSGWKKKHLSSQKLLALMQWKAVTKAI